MSSTIPSASRSARANAASTTYVAPCRACAGPNTSPGRLWATIMWSLTVTSNISVLRYPIGVGFSGVVADRVAERRQRPGGQLAHQLGQLVERRLPREQCVERRITEQPQGEGRPVGVRATTASRPGDLPHLARLDPQARGVEAPAERQLDRGVAVPAEVGDHAV